MNRTGNSVVVLTGAIGAVGREQLGRTVRVPGTRVICLVRAANDQDVEARLAQTLDEMTHQPLSSEETARITALSGNITKRRLGFTAARWEALAEEATRIVHGAANVSWSLPIVEARRINVGGTQEMLRLAEAAASRGNLDAFDYISSAMVADCGGLVRG